MWSFFVPLNKLNSTEHTASHFPISISWEIWNTLRTKHFLKKKTNLLYILNDLLAGKCLKICFQGNHNHHDCFPKSSYYKSSYGAHTLSISCTKSVISCKASIFFLVQGFRAVFFHHIVIVSCINYHNMVKKYCILMYTE